MEIAGEGTGIATFDAEVEDMNKDDDVPILELVPRSNCTALERKNEAESGFTGEGKGALEVTEVSKDLGAVKVTMGTVDFQRA